MRDAMIMVPTVYIDGALDIDHTLLRRRIVDRGVVSRGRRWGIIVGRPAVASVQRP
jgi:hypothetical protein